MTPEEIISQTLHGRGLPYLSPSDAHAVSAALTAAGYSIVPTEPTEEISDAIYEAETHGATSPEVWRAAISAAVKEG